jgi:hypothetical protein
VGTHLPPPPCLTAKLYHYSLLTRHPLPIPRTSNSNRIPRSLDNPQPGRACAMGAECVLTMRPRSELMTLDSILDGLMRFPHQPFDLYTLWRNTSSFSKGLIPIATCHQRKDRWLPSHPLRQPTPGHHPGRLETGLLELLEFLFLRDSPPTELQPFSHPPPTSCPSFHLS